MSVGHDPRARYEEFLTEAAKEGVTIRAPGPGEVVPPPPTGGGVMPPTPPVGEPAAPSQADAAARYQQFLQEGQGEAQGPLVVGTPPPEGVREEFGRVVRKGTAEGVAATLGLPVDLVNTVINAYNTAVSPITRPLGGAPIPTIPIGGREQIKEAAGQLAEDVRGAGVPVPPIEEPRTAPGRVAAGAIEEAIPAVVTGAAGKVTGMVGGLGELGQKMAAIPWKDLVKLESLVAGGSGALGKVAREFTDNPLVELAARLLGAFGMSGALGVTRWYRTRFQPAKTMAGAEKEVGRYLHEAIPPGSQMEQNLERAGEITSRFPEVKLTTAQATRSPELLKQTGRLAAEHPGIGAEIAEQPGRATTAMTGAVERAAGQPVGDVAATQAALRQQQAAREAAAAAETRGLRQEEARRRLGVAEEVRTTRAREERIGAQVDETARAAREDTEAAVRALPRMNRVQAGRVIDDIITTRGAAVKEAAGALFDQVDDTLSLNTGALRTRVDEVVTEAARGVGPQKVIPSSIRDIARDLAEQEADPARSFGDVRRWRSGVLADLREAEPGSLQSRMLARVAEAIDGTLDQAAESSAEYRRAAAAYRDYIERFRQGVVGQVQQRGPRGERLAKPVDDVARQFWRSSGRGGAETSARQYLAAVGDVPQAREALVGAALDDFTQLVSPNGKVSSRLAQRWLNDHREVLNVFPEVRDMVQGVVARAVRAESVEGLATSTRKYLDGKGATRTASKTEQALRGQEVKPVEAVEDAAFRQFTGADPREAVSTILRADDRGQTARRMVDAVQREPAAMAGLQRAFADEMQKASRGRPGAVSGHPLFDPENYGKFLEKHEEVAQALFGPAGVRDLKELQRVGTILMTPLKADSIPAITRGISKQSLFTIDSMLSRAYNIRRGMVSLGYSLSDIGVRLVSKHLESIGAENLRVVLDRALFDPDAARQILKLGRELATKEGEDAARQFNTYAVNLVAQQAPRQAQRDRLLMERVEGGARR
jgi:hypothetical protein